MLTAPSLMGGDEMKYYKQMDADENIIALCSCDDDSIPVGTTELTEEEYNNALAALAKADADAAAQREAERKAAQEAAEKAAEERQNTISDYVTKVKAGTAKLEEVPEEYRNEVDYIVNPPTMPPTNSELSTRLETAESAIDFLITTIANVSES